MGNGFIGKALTDPELGAGIKLIYTILVIAIATMSIILALAYAALRIASSVEANAEDIGELQGDDRDQENRISMNEAEIVGIIAQKDEFQRNTAVIIERILNRLDER